MSGPDLQSFIRRRFVLPSRKLVEIRRVACEQPAEVVVREVDENNRLACFEYILRWDFLLNHGQPVRNL